MNELINLGNGQMVKVTMLKGERGSNIATITKTGTSGLTDTYTITLTDGSTSTFEVKNGSSIQSITKTSTVGAVDTYTITLTDGTTAGTFTVTNATGTIDQNFSASSTDPLMNKTLSGIIAGVENGSTASKTYNKNDLILRNDSLYEVQTTVASGGTWADGVNIVETTIGDLLSAGKSALTDNGESFKFGYDSVNDEMGYYKKVGGADTFFPFKKEPIFVLNVGWNNNEPPSNDTTMFYFLVGCGNHLVLNRMGWTQTPTYTDAGYFIAQKTTAYNHIFKFTFLRKGKIRYYDSTNNVRVEKDMDVNESITTPLTWDNTQLLFFE